MTGWEAALLGVIQGLTEFLPISSSGHLVLAKAVFGVQGSGIAFEVFVHFGTLMAVITVFRKDLWQITLDFTELVKSRLSRASGAVSGPDQTRQNMVILLIVGTLPAALLGYAFKDTFERFFSDPRFVCGALIITGVILLMTKFRNQSDSELNLKRSFWIGLAQVGAFFPGVSRSGTTISAGLLLGLKPIESARFSFLLAVPLITGVTILQLLELVGRAPSQGEILVFVLGSVFAYFSGLMAIKWLLGIVQRSRIDRFGYYCLAVGLAGLLAYRLQLI